MEAEFIVIDTETTGLDRGSRMVELAAIRFDASGVISIFESLVNPEMPIPPDTVQVHGITNEVIASAPTAQEVLLQLLDWLGPNRALIGHYALYDTGIISWDAARAGVALPDELMVACTREISRALHETKSHRLEDLVEHYSIGRCGIAHRALSDADACMKFFRLALDRNIPDLYQPKPWNDAGHDYRYCEPPHGIQSLVATGAPFSFAYEDKDGAATERTITPYGWHERGGQVYVHGFCHLRQARREFRADRITLPETVS